MTDYLGVIPARSGSKTVPRKNVRELDGKPLLAYTVEAAETSSIDYTVLSTDSEEIRDVALSHGANAPFLRPPELATDDAPTEPVITHAVEYVEEHDGLEVDAIVLLQPTSPARDADHIDEALSTYEASDGDSLVAVTEDHSNRWRLTEDGATKVNYQDDRRRQEVEPEYVETGAIYVVDRDRFLETSDLRTGATELYVMDRPSSVDIDTPFEFWLAERVIADWKTQERCDGDGVRP